MKVLYVLAALCCYTIVVETCFQKDWRGHKVMCCPNGTATELAPNQKVWVAQKAIVCGASTIKEKSGSKLTKVIKWLMPLFTLALIAGFCWRKFPCQRVAAIITKCCPDKANAAENLEEVKVVKAKAEATLLRSQSF